MTDPTPTRAEVEALCVRLDAERTHWVRCIETEAATMLRSLNAENQALRERAEAAEKERDASRKWEAHYHTAWEIACKKRWEATDRAVSLEKKLTEARRAEAAAWKSGFEVAAGVVFDGKGLVEKRLIGLSLSGYGMPLRRAAPTEGEA